MNFRKWYLMSLLALFIAFSANAHISPLNNSPNNSTPNVNSNSGASNIASFRNDCVKPIKQIDQDINNVRARLTTGGDVWWDRTDGKYIVPKPLEPGDKEVSAIFAGGVWLGGVQEGGFKVAAQQYGNGNGNTRDFWTGPLNPSTDPTLLGTTADSICFDWDRFWVVTGAEIDLHISQFNAAAAAGIDYDPADIPLGVKGWPGKGNPFFVQINNFELPNTTQGLGAFWDADGDERYNPSMGDFPIIEIEGCTAPQYPDQMFFWIYNDAGNIHTESNGNQIKMEIQVQSFAYETNDALNDMTFQRYKLINRASSLIEDTYFAMWVDADLGCFTDDYIGCDTTRSLAYYYNVDPEDGDVGIECGSVETYGTTIPALGIDYFRGPKEPLLDNNNEPILDEFGDAIETELGMSSFTYFNNPGEGNPPPPETDPTSVIEYYQYMSGLWGDGTPYTEGGNGYGGTTPVKYVFPDPPDDQEGWSMCTASAANNPEYDRRTVQASGPFTLLPGAVNELIVGAVWVPDFAYPCPNLDRLFNADDLAQNLFDSCFDILDGPDAPDVDIIELDKELVLILTNSPDTAISNNARELYHEDDINAPEGEEYLFQGYQVFQLVNGQVSRDDYGDPDKSRLIAQFDIKDDITSLYNWEALKDEDVPDYIADPVFVSTLQVEGANQGIKHTAVVTKDLFAGDNATLVNHKKYYFAAVAYGYNNWQNFDPALGEGQARPYVRGRRNINTYTAVPRPITDRNLNAAYGDGVEITRLDGVGNGGLFLDLTDETVSNITNASSFANGGRFDQPIVYREGFGPIDVKIYNPLDVKDGNFKIDILDGDFGSDGELKRWRMTLNTDVETDSENTIDALNEQIIGEYGFTVSIGQASEPGSLFDDANGAIGAVEEYADENAEAWFLGISNQGQGLIDDALFLGEFLNFAAPTDLIDEDPTSALATMGSGFLPYKLAEYRTTPYPLGNVSPAWQNNSNNLIRNTTSYEDLNNVNIVFTSEKSLWSRCVIVETSTGTGLAPIGGADNLDPRQSPSVGKDDNDGDGFPDVDNSGMGMGYFPGYAIDVETGQRLNIFFGENSSYNCSTPQTENFCDFYTDGEPTGADMMFNPSSQFFSPLSDPQTVSAFNLILGGQHFIYVTKQAYDGCSVINEGLNGNSLARVNVLKEVTWAGVSMLNPGTTMKSYKDGLIPTDLTVKLRVNNRYEYEQGTDAESGTNPAYEFAINGKQAGDLDEAGIENQLDQINIVPNPYYAFSDYDKSNNDNVIKITNLPAKCVVSIYTLDGKFVRRYDRDETAQAPVGTGIAKTQIIPDIEWNMKNSKNIPIAGGVYLIHVDAEGLGERVLKWFGTNRSLDPSNL